MDRVVCPTLSKGLDWMSSAAPLPLYISVVLPLEREEAVTFSPWKKLHIEPVVPWRRKESLVLMPG